MRYVIVGAGGVGGAFAAALIAANQTVLVVARGAHGQAIERDGLELRQPAGSRRVHPPVAPSVTDVELDGRDIVIVAVKSQDAEEVFDGLGAQLRGRPVVLAQNGVHGERIASERGARPIGAMVWIPAVHLEPGVVAVHADVPMGAVRLGAWPRGAVEPVARDLAAALAAGGFDAEAVDDVDRWKYGKLLSNLGNAIDAFAVRDGGGQQLWQRAAREAEQVFDAAGLPYVPARQLIDDMSQRVASDDIEGAPRGGGSSWQSATRGRSSEVPYLNGAISRLGRDCGVATPVNDTLVAIAAEAPPPRSVPTATIAERIDA